ncbi:MAG: UTP--glucose-1-phosphate uridylyltransferase GalU [Neisseriaceae bacterium]
MKRIKKVVLPVAGMGTRFLPATKAMPKEMLPIVDKPLVQYAVEEAIDAGCTEIIFIIGRNKHSIEDHFDKAYELECELAYKQKEELLNCVRSILPKQINCLYIRQNETLGLGHAILKSLPAVGNEPFAVILADDLIDAKPGALKQMVMVYEELGVSVVAVEEIALDKTEAYGIVKVESVAGRLYINSIVEKPKPDKAPSNLAVVGRYLLTPKIYELLAVLPKGVGGEIQLTDAIERLLQYEQVVAYPFEGERYDCGSKIGYLEANLAYGLKHPQTATSLRQVVLKHSENLKDQGG